MIVEESFFPYLTYARKEVLIFFGKDAYRMGVCMIKLSERYDLI